MYSGIQWTTAYHVEWRPEVMSCGDQCASTTDACESSKSSHVSKASRAGQPGWRQKSIEPQLRWRALSLREVGQLNTRVHIQTLNVQPFAA